MPQQAILDLPIIEFEPFYKAPERMHSFCIDRYGISGLGPQPDIVFHFGASLWRYREAESPKQVAGLAAGYIRALNQLVAARRRLAAARGGTISRDRILRAEEDLEIAAEDLDDVTQIVLEFVGDLLELTRSDESRARRRLDANVAAIAEPGWAETLEHNARGFCAQEPKVRWTDSLVDVLESLEDAELPTNGASHALDERVVGSLQSELDNYRELATQASARLQEIETERRELERRLTQGAPVGDHAELEQLLREAGERLSSLEAAYEERIAKLQAERDRLAEELMDVLSRATDTESSQEELLHHIETAASDRLEAADAIDALSARLATAQQEAEAAAGTAAQWRARVRELEAQVNELRQELAAEHERLTQAQATIEGLESSAGLNSEFENLLTDSEARLADTQSTLEEAELRVDALTGELEDTRYELERAKERAAKDKKTVDSISGQLAEAETLADELEARVSEADRENDRLRRDLSDAQSRMLDARGDLEEARNAEAELKAEVERLRESAKENAAKADGARAESEAAQVKLATVESELDNLRNTRTALASQLEGLKEIAETSAQRFKEFEESNAALKAELEQSRQAQDELRKQLESARDEVRTEADRADTAEKALADAGTQTTRYTAESEAAKSALERARNDTAQAKAKVVELEGKLADAAAERESAAELAEERRRKHEEKLELLKQRMEVAEQDKGELAKALQQAEKARAAQQHEVETLLERREAELAEARNAASSTGAETGELRKKLAETEAFLIARQRELERAESRYRSTLDEIGTVADLRTQYEQSEDAKQREKIASQIAGRLDSLFVAAGRPVHADRRTEKVLVLQIKKSAAELHEQAEKPYVATKGDDVSKANTPSAEGPDQAQSGTET